MGLKQHAPLILYTDAQMQRIASKSLYAKCVNKEICLLRFEHVQKFQFILNDVPLFIFKPREAFSTTKKEMSLFEIIFPTCNGHGHYTCAFTDKCLS